MHPVDALLDQARQLLGTATPPTPPPPAPTADLAELRPAAWTGAANSAAATTSDELGNKHRALRTVAHNAAAIIGTTNTIGPTAREDLHAVQTAWQQDKDTHSTTTAQGQAALLQAGRQRITEAAAIVENAANHYRRSAEQLTTTTRELPHAGEHAVQATDFTNTPQAPTQDDPRKYWLSIDDIVRRPPGALGPFGYMELAPNSGVWVPDPAHVGIDQPPCRNPIDLSKIVRRAPGEQGPWGYTELVPGAGTWIPDPDPRPHAPTPAPPRAPIDLRRIVHRPPGEQGPWGYTELLPGTWVPAP